MTRGKCDNCGNEVSREADACPKCGHPNTEPGNIPWGKISLIILGFAGMIWWMVAGTSSSPPGNAVPHQSTENVPLEYKLASLNAGTSVDKNDVTVTRFKYLLEKISEKTGDDQVRIGDMTVYG